MPKCQKCGNVMKPHVLLWDECINEEKYRTNTVREFTKAADCLIVVGTTLETEKGKRIVNSLLRKNIPVIEVNPTSVIRKGKNLQVLQKPEVALPELFKTYYELTKPPVPKQSVTSKATVVASIRPKQATAQNQPTQQRAISKPAGVRPETMRVANTLAPS